MVGLLSALVL